MEPLPVAVQNVRMSTHHARPHRRSGSRSHAGAALLALALAAGGGVPLGCETAPTTEAERTSLSASSQAAMETFIAEDPSLQQLLDRAAGWAIFPEVGKAGLGIGGSFGRGEVYERGVLIGFADITQGTIGLQAGAQTFSELVVFMLQEDLNRFKEGEFRLAANASAVAIKPGAAASANLRNDVLVFVRTTGGLMAEAAVGGQVFRFEPL